jgi:two-component system, OmpR family, response regulator
MVNVLIVDDNKNIRNLTRIHLEREGYTVFTAADGEEALNTLDSQLIHLIIVDIMMPKMDGYQLTGELRRSGYTMPVLMLTAKEGLEDKRQGFETGADDYLTKPANMEELLMRVKALLRRAKISFEKVLVMGSTTLNYETLEAATAEETIILPKKEFYLLYLLLSYPRKIFTRQDIMDEIWGYDAEADIRTVDVHIKRLREKFQGSKDFEIVTIRGLGYKAERRT